MKKNYLNLVKTTFIAWKNDNISRLAAALAYYTAFSLAPLLTICIAITGLLFGQDQSQREILSQVSSLFGPDSAKQVHDMIVSASKPTSGIIATIIGIILLLFGATGVFAELQDGLNKIWGVESKPNLGFIQIIKKRFLSFAMVLGVAFLLLVSLIISTIITAMGNYLNQLIPGLNTMWLIINFCISIMIITLLFAMIFKVLPDVLIKWRDVWIGAFSTAILFTLGKFVLEIYLSHSNVASAYGAAGSLIIILVWVYYSAQILFLGAEFTKINAKYNGSMIKPSKSSRYIKS